MCKMFLILKTVYFTSYKYDNSPFAVADNIANVMESLEQVCENLVTWFSDNQMKLNPDKCHQLLNTKEQTTSNTFFVQKIIRYKFQLQAKLPKAY